MHVSNICSCEIDNEFSSNFVADIVNCCNCIRMSHSWAGYADLVAWPAYWSSRFLM